MIYVNVIAFLVNASMIIHCDEQTVGWYTADANLVPIIVKTPIGSGQGSDRTSRGNLEILQIVNVLTNFINLKVFVLVKFRQIFLSRVALDSKRF